MGAWRSSGLAPARSYSEQAGVGITDGVLGVGIAAFILWAGTQARAARLASAASSGQPGAPCGCVVPAGWSPPTVTGGCPTCNGCLTGLTVTPGTGGVAPLSLSG